MNTGEFYWHVFVLDTSVDDLVLDFNFVGTIADLHKKLDYLYSRFNGFDNINIKIIMK